MTVAIIDYGMSNLGSVSHALTVLGAAPEIVERPEQLATASRIVLPGVGSFADGMAHLVDRGWVDAIRDQVAIGKPLLGICLGMQLLASRGTEGGEIAGLDLIPGDIVRLSELGCGLRVPHVGWNSVTGLSDAGPLFEDIPEDTDFYFAHSYAFLAGESSDVLAYVDYGIPIAAAIGRRHVRGTQFHPEKSSRAGFRLLRNFLEWQPC